MSQLVLDREVLPSGAHKDSVTGWTHAAELVGARCATAPVDASGILELAALQCAYHDALVAFEAAAPGYFLDLLQNEETGNPLAPITATWSVPRHMSPVHAALIIDAISVNAALDSFSTATGSNRWRTTPECTQWAAAIKRTDALWDTLNGFEAPGGLLLRSPALAFPDDVSKQLQWAFSNWRGYLSESTRDLYQLSKDIAAEAHTVRTGAPGPAQNADLATSFSVGLPGHVDHQDQFSEDADWMPQLVLIAKQSFVWLDQLSREYGRPIERLDQIPDEELVRLASRGFTGLWLIGLWERSGASRQIKRRRGNKDAAASAYALRGYTIATRLGGDEALADLRERAEARGIRLAADMVPNHMGMDSEWMVDHPERFVQLPHPPYPGYSFEGPNLSEDDRIEVYLEDGYWDERDAAVVFKSIHRDTGKVRYIYHGNDGTQMPWNDTAQLDYLQAEVREAVLQAILHVARRFPVIRFDAAMALARKHISRLWYPAPGQGGAIPSRSENTVPAEVFDTLLPGEFWREVVERIRDEAPGTLLLAEAFWMMEGYFVRTLGMHRVYNSAFMHMLRDEDNAGYRAGIKDVLEYSPAILERYVNFMNNPDEETAVAQFGKEDKYFGVATMMATLPGLPMFGHGQIEGYAEKYGMEFTRAYGGELPDPGLVEHHERVIFPLLRDRHLFCGVKHFALFDFYCGEDVNEDVFAYANQSEESGDCSLVIYHNAFKETAGWIRSSAPVNVGECDTPALKQRTLGSALHVRDDSSLIYGLWESKKKAWLLRSGAELHSQGLFTKLSGYEALVFTRISEIHDPDDRFSVLASQSKGEWVSDADFKKCDGGGG